MELYPYQKKTKKKMLKCLREYGVSFLAAEERTGKTLTSFFTLEEIGANRVLVVSILAAIPDIRGDYLKAKGHLHFDLDVINYESLHKVVGDYDAVIFDESSKLAAYPKMNNITESAQRFINSNCIEYIILLNATPSVESYAQYYHPFKICGLWEKYPNFYKWFAKYGIPSTVRIAGGRTIPSYKQVKEDKILKVY